MAMASPTRSFKDNTVRLISAEGFEFVIDYEAACVSNTIKNMLSSQGKVSNAHTLTLVCVITHTHTYGPLFTDALVSLYSRSLFARHCSFSFPHSFMVFVGSFTESELGEIRFPEISTPILEKVCQYFYYKLRYTNRYAILDTESESESESGSHSTHAQIERQAFELKA